jgi:hypothetical protein
MKDQLEGCYLKDAVEIQNALQEVTHGDFQKCFKLYECFIATEESYFEGNCS